MSRRYFEETADSAGYFKPYFQKFRNSLKQDQLDEFKILVTNEDRIKLISKILPASDNVKCESNNGKSGEIFQQMRERGNAEFVRGDTYKSLISYSNAVRSVPFSTNDNKDLAVALANRSAALYHLEQFQEAVQDIDLALTLAYPSELRYKIQERKAKCLLALKRHADALDTFKKTLHCLDDSKLNPEKKMKMQKNIQLMLSLLMKQKTTQGHINALLEGAKPGKKDVPIVTGKKNPLYPSMSDSVTIKTEEGLGRYAVAAKNIPAGDTIVVEQAYTSVLILEFTKNHCIHCFKWVEAPYPCEGCSIAVFCGNKKCQDAALSSYHKIECSIVKSLYESGASVMVHMALRIITQRPLEYFINLRPSLQETSTLSVNDLKNKRSDDYARVYHLICHEEQRNSEDFLERTVMAVFLLRILQKVGYFGHERSAQDNNLINSDELLIGGLILRHLQFLQFNAHEIAEIETDCITSVDETKSVLIGGGVFPTVAMLNHSCDPGIVRYFNGNTMVVRTIRPVEEGKQVAENYGPIFTVKQRADRRKELRALYWFDCNCQACEEDWPLLTQMDRKIIRFRCDGGPEIQCAGVLLVPLSTEDFMVKCGTCGRHTNILKGLKILQDTDAMFRQASIDADGGRLQSAMDIYLEVLKLLHTHLAPPFYDYSLCQQAIRKCMLSLGNKYVKDF